MKIARENTARALRLPIALACASFLSACEAEPELVNAGLSRFAPRTAEVLGNWEEALKAEAIAPQTDDDVPTPGVDPRWEEAPLPAGVQAWLDRVVERSGAGAIPPGVEVRYRESGGMPPLSDDLVVRAGSMACTSRKFEPQSQLHIVEACTLAVNEAGVALVNQVATPSLWERRWAASPRTLGCATVTMWTISGQGGRLHRSYRQDAAESGVWPSGVARHLCNTIRANGTCKESRTR
jgi:hypothetical protein